MLDIKGDIQIIIDSSPAGVIIADREGTIILANQSAHDCFNIKHASLTGINISRFIPTTHRKKHDKYLHQFSSNSVAKPMKERKAILAKDINGEDILLKIGLSPIKVDNEQCSLATIINVTDEKFLEKLKKSNADLGKMANYDEVTGLANRYMFKASTHSLLALAQRHKLLSAILFIDLNKFKPINDQYGHDIGDQVLIAVADVLKKIPRDSDICCRYGGDEFLLYFHNIVNKDNAISLKNKIKQKINDIDFKVINKKISLSASIGIALSFESSDTIENLIKEADNAMYADKFKS